LASLKEDLSVLVNAIIYSADSGEIQIPGFDRRETLRPQHVPREYITFVRHLHSALEKGSLSEGDVEFAASQLVYYVLTETEGRIKKYGVMTPYFEIALSICRQHQLSDKVASWIEQQIELLDRDAAMRARWGDVLAYEIRLASNQKQHLLPMDP